MALSKVKSNMIDGSASAITKNASDPTASTNPSAGVGTIWANTTSGETYVCTDATTNANVWKNIGDGTGEIAPNVLPTNPTNGGAFNAITGHNQTVTYTFSGATDSDGTVTHYKVDNINVASNIFNVSSAEVAAGSPHSFVVGTVGANTAVSFRVRAKDNSGGYSTGTTVSTSVQPTIATQYLVIGGGGGGEKIGGGGGGAGGYREGTVGLSTGSTYVVTVGAGGVQYLRGASSSVVGGTWSSNHASGVTTGWHDGIGGGTIANLFDGNNSTEFDFSGQYYNRWFAFDLGTARKIQKYTLKAVASNAAGESFKKWALSASNDTTNGTDGTWYGLHGHPGDQTGWSNNEVRTYTFECDTAYRYFRFSMVDSQNTSDSPNMQEIEMFERATAIVVSGFSGGGGGDSQKIYGTGGRTYWGFTERDGGSGAGSSAYGDVAPHENTAGKPLGNQGYVGGDGGRNSPLSGGGLGGGGGGGGAGQAGTHATNQGYGGAGGDGKSSNITGSNVTRAGGGGGGGWGGAPTGDAPGGAGGGGTGAAGAGNSAAGGNGSVNTGSGGGGHGRGTSANSNPAGSGGSGVVYLKIPTADYNSSGLSGGSASTVGSDTLLTFTGDGSYTA